MPACSTSSDQSSDASDEIRMDRYFMSQEDQDAVIGRLIREKKAAEVKKSALYAEAHRIAEDLKEIAGHLEKRLSGLQVQGGSLNSEFLPFEAWIKPTALQELKKIIPLANEYRETILNLKRISGQLKQAGIE